MACHLLFPVKVEAIIVPGLSVTEARSGALTPLGWNGTPLPLCEGQFQSRSLILSRCLASASSKRPSECPPRLVNTHQLCLALETFRMSSRLFVTFKMSLCSSTAECLILQSALQTATAPGVGRTRVQVHVVPFLVGSRSPFHFRCLLGWG